jgi:raffinose/stachyose/melibiose transport system permease protein
MKNTRRAVVIGASAIVLTAIFFVVPFVFVIIIASKDVTESAALEFS